MSESPIPRSISTNDQDDHTELASTDDSNKAIDLADMQENPSTDAEQTPASSHSSPKSMQDHSLASVGEEGDLKSADLTPSNSSVNLATQDSIPVTSGTITQLYGIETQSFPREPTASKTIDNISLLTPLSTPVRRPRHKPGERRELLIRAVEDVLNLKISMRRAAQKYNLAKSSLCDFVRKNNIPLPNLRFKSCPNGSEPNAISSSLNLVSNLKRLSTDTPNHSGSHSVPHKIPCGVGRKSSNLRASDPHVLQNSFTDCYDNTQASLSRPAHLPKVGSSVSCESFSAEDSLKEAQSSTHVDQCSSSNRGTISVGGTTSVFSFPKPNRMESPWYNSAGLPTQVPLRTWNVPHNHQLVSSSLGTHEPKVALTSTGQTRQSVVGMTTSIPEMYIQTVSGAMDLSDFKASHLDVNSLSQLIGNAIETSSNLTTSVVTDPTTEAVRSHSANREDCGADRTTSELRINRSDVPCSSEDLMEHDYEEEGVVGCTQNSTTRSTPCPTPDLISNNNNVSMTRMSDNFMHQTNIPIESATGNSSYPACSSSADRYRTFSTTNIPSNLNFKNTVNTPPVSFAAHSDPPASTMSGLLPEFTSLNQAALAALLTHCPRSIPGGLSTLPQVLSHLNSLSFPLNPSATQNSIHPSFDLPNSSCTPPTDVSFNLNNTRPITDQIAPLHLASVLKQLSNHSLADADRSTDLLHQFGLNELQQLLNRQLLSRLPNYLNQTPANLASLLAAAQLIPNLSAQSPNVPLRALLTNLSCSQSSPAVTTTTTSTVVAPELNSSEASPFQLTGSNSQPSTSGHHRHHQQQYTHNINNTVDLDRSVKMQLLTNAYIQDFLKFINNSPSPFHAVQLASELLISNDFRELKEGEPWNLKPLDRFFVRKNGSTLIAATVGGNFKPGNGFYMLGAHTDSPCLRLKPVSERVREGCMQVGVQTYGGGLWYTWLDRELKVAGRVVSSNSEGRLKEYLVHINKPIACVPSLAVHLNREVNTQGFIPNLEQHLAPLLCTCVADQLVNCDVADSVPSPGQTRRHPLGLTRLICNELNIPHNPEMLELELYFSDFQEARLGGLHNEFIHAPRLDNLFNSYTGLRGLVDSLGSLSEETSVRVLCLYDHEEVGSTSSQGANSAYTINLLRRIAIDLNTSCSTSELISKTHFEEALSKSFILSADQAHAVHPSYADKCEANHKPQLHGGIVLKTNVNQRYASNASTSAAVRHLGRIAAVPVQEYVVRQDMSCGSTIGPFLSSQMGVSAVDVGFPQLAMHSCRELCSTTSVDQAVRFYRAFYENISKIWPIP